MSACRLLLLRGLPILEQLRIEEALLRADTGSWCLVHTEAPPALVMGISARAEEVLHLPRIVAEGIPVVRRFSGGGTVYIDRNTLFVTFICNEEESGVACTPEAILRWSLEVYHPLIPDLAVRENDYVLGERKCGGNAQYLRRGRWLHHTSFLWEYDPEAMEAYVKMPPKMPRYRLQRPHRDFLTPLRPYFPDKEQLVSALKKVLATRFSVQEAEEGVVEALCARPHRRTCCEVTAHAVPLSFISETCEKYGKRGIRTLDTF